MIKYIVSTITALLIGFTLQAQITILNTNINSYNITPQSICQVNVMNYAQEVKVSLEARITNSAGESILNAESQPFILRKGMNNISGYNLSISSSEFGHNNQANYSKNSHTLPSGKYNYCCVIKSLTTEASDDYCEDIEADLSSFLLLISPADKDTIETPNPMLIWTHSEPFNLLAHNEYFKIILVELMNDQNAPAN